MFPADWSPRSAAQRDALRSNATVLLFGGAAGSLKSETLLVDAVRECRNPNLRAILFRRSYPELEKTLIRRSRQLYPSLGGIYNEQKRAWTFPGGATVEFAYCETDKDVFRYQGGEYSFIGFDESTHFGEFPIRYMLSRLRTRDPRLRLRLRLASNPGNVGHNFHRSLFMAGKCAHCASPSAAVPQPRAVRPTPLSEELSSLSQPLPFSTGFIPATVRDHNLLNRDYAASLESLPGAFRRALLEGCWDVYEGQYFDHWKPSRMTTPCALIGARPAWPHWIGADYGFNTSQAAAYLFAKGPASDQFPDGRTYVLDEFTAHHQTAADFARALAARFARFHPRVVYLSPDCFSNRGEDHTLADQMRNAAPLAFEPAAADRVGGAMLIYTQLAAGELVVADTCRQLLDAIPSRIHDPARPDDILKVAADPLDDCIDALRYGLYSYFAPPRAQPAPAVSPDPTIAALQHRLAAEKWRAPSHASYLARRR